MLLGCFVRRCKFGSTQLTASIFNMSILRVFRYTTWILSLLLLASFLANPAKSLYTRQEEIEANEDFEASELVEAKPVPAGPRLYFLTQGMSGKIISISPRGGEQTTVLSGLTNTPDGIAVDKEAGFFFFNNIGTGR